MGQVCRVIAGIEELAKSLLGVVQDRRAGLLDLTGMLLEFFHVRGHLGIELGNVGFEQETDAVFGVRGCDRFPDDRVAAVAG